TTVFAEHRMTAPGRVDRQAACRVAAQRVGLSPIQHEDVLISEVLMKRGTSSRLVSKERSLRPLLASLIQPLDIDPRMKRFPPLFRSQRCGSREQIGKNQWSLQGIHSQLSFQAFLRSCSIVHGLAPLSISELLMSTTLPRHTRPSRLGTVAD